MHLNKTFLFTVFIYSSGCVQAAQCAGELLSSKERLGDEASIAPDLRFKLNKGEAYDTKTKLIWKRCIEGMNWDQVSNTCTGKAEKMTWDKMMATYPSSGAEWRIPSVEELASIRTGDGYVYAGCWNPAINISVFPDKQDGWYWTSSLYPKNPQQVAIGIGFKWGGIDSSERSNTHLVRLVRTDK